MQNMTRCKATATAPRSMMLLFVFLFVSCARVWPLGISESYFCDQYKNGSCLLKHPENVHSYQPAIPAARSGTWFDLGYYMYFHTRETPGIRVDFNRTMTQAEQKELLSSLHCELVLQTKETLLKSEMEGRRLDSKGFWCFDYLGSNLVSLLKKLKKEREAPDPNFFPIELEIHWKTAFPKIQGRKKSKLIVLWQSK